MKPLTDAQSRVLHLLAEGLSNRLIARRLELSTETVKVHVRRLLDATGTANRTALAVWAMRRGLVPCPCTSAAKQSGSNPKELPATS